MSALIKIRIAAKYLLLKSGVLLASSIVMIPQVVVAQAGSRAPIFFQAQQDVSFNAGGSVSLPFTKGELRSVAPAGVWKLAPTTRYLLWVELVQGRLNVLENLGEAGLVLRKRIPVSIGKHGIGKKTEGDNKTPIGVYQLREFLPDTQLDDVYGVGAYTLNYPNVYDLLQGHSGHGIWLHGLPKSEDQRPFLASEGCVVIDNASLLALADEISLDDTPIVLSPTRLQWVPLSESFNEAQGLLKTLTAWEAAWEARDTPQYLDFYAEDFTDLQRNKQGWSAYKSLANASKQFIDVDLSELSILVEPNQPDVVKVLFHQDYRSDTLQWGGNKEQLWRRENQTWKIIYEGDR